MAGKQCAAVGAAANYLLGILVGLMSVSVLILFGVLSDSPRRWQCPAFVFRFSFVFSKELQLCNKMIQLHGGERVARKRRCISREHVRQALYAEIESRQENLTPAKVVSVPP